MNSLITGWNSMAAERNRLTSRSRVVIEDCGPDSAPELCTCREAVSRAFAGMTASGAPRNVALEAATRVYCYHHPEAGYNHAHHTVEHWVTGGTVH